MTALRRQACCQAATWGQHLRGVAGSGRAPLLEDCRQLGKATCRGALTEAIIGRHGDLLLLPGLGVLPGGVHGHNLCLELARLGGCSCPVVRPRCQLVLLLARDAELLGHVL